MYYQTVYLCQFHCSLPLRARSESPVEERKVKGWYVWLPWWRHQMETFSALLAICAGNSPVPGEFPHKGQWRGALMFSLICVWINGWVNNREAGDLRRYRTHYDVIVMEIPYYIVKCAIHICTFAITETGMSTFWRNFRQWLHRKLSTWQLTLHPVTNISQKMAYLFLW